jgi:hypothetical protein
MLEICVAKYRKFCQKSLWDEWEKPDEEIRKVAEKFVMANCYDPKVACQKFSGKRGVMMEGRLVTGNETLGL